MQSRFHGMCRGILRVAVACVAFTALPTSAALLFETDAATGTSSFRTELGIMTRFEVASEQTLTSVAVQLDLNQAAGNLNFVIFDSISGALLFQSGAQSFSDDGMTFKQSADFLFTLLPGTRYAIGAQTDVSADYAFIQPGGKTVGDITSLGGNQNANGFLNPVLDLGLAGTDGSIRLFGEPGNGGGTVPVPMTLALFGVGLAGLGFGRRIGR